MTAASHLKTLLPMIGRIKTFVEVGVLRGSTTLELAGAFPAMTFIGVDSYRAYRDDLFSPYSVSKELAALNRSIAQERFDKIGATLLIEDSMEALDRFDCGRADAVFLDAYMNQDQVVREVSGWYRAVRGGGLLCGHDANSPVVMNGLREALHLIGATESVTVIGNEVWYLIKNEKSPVSQAS